MTAQDQIPTLAITFFKDDGDKWRWRCRSVDNKKINAVSGQAFSRKDAAVRAAQRIAHLFTNLTHVVVHEEPPKRKPRSKT